MMAAKPKQCKFHTTHANKRCRHLAPPGKYYCDLHAQRFASKDPERRARQLANLKVGRSIPSNQHLARTFSAEATGLAEKIEDISKQVLQRDDAGGVPVHLTRRVLRAAKAEMELEHLEKFATLTVRQERRREVLEKQLEKLYDDLGMSSRARIEYEPLERAQRVAKAARAIPKRTDPVHIKQVIGVTMRSGQFNEASMKWAAAQDPRGNGRDILLNHSELVALGLADEEPEEETTDTPPRLAEVLQFNRKDTDAQPTDEESPETPAA